MVLVVVDALCTLGEEKKLSIAPTEVKYNHSLACFKVHSGDLPRKRPPSCIKQHPKVGDIMTPDLTHVSLCILHYVSHVIIQKKIIFIL
jgi:hypothetical protein